MTDTHPTSRRIIAGSDGNGTPDKAPKPDAMQVLTDSMYVSPDLTRHRRFNPDRETPIGTDDRTRVTDFEAVPWRKICQLSFKAGGVAESRGTGWLAGPKTIVTAGHNLLGIRFDRLSTDMRVTPGRGGPGVEPFNTVRPTRFSVHERWASGREPEFDIGCIHLEEPIGDTVGWFSFANVDDETLGNAFVNIAGYPVDGPEDGPEQGMVPYFHANKVHTVKENRFYYLVDTSGGQSGAPVWIRETPESPPVVVGIHCYGEGEKEAKTIGEVNSATRINPKMVALIKSWIAADQDGTSDAGAGAGPIATVPIISDQGANEAAMVELRQFVSDNGGQDANLAISESGAIGNDMANLSITALGSAVTKFEGLIGRLLRRTRVQQRLDLWSSILTLILSSSLFAAAQASSNDATTGVNPLTFWLGLLTVLSAIIALIAKRMGGGEGGLVAKYTELQSLAFEARLLSDVIRTKAKHNDADLAADIEKALTTTRRLSKEKDWMQASDFLFKDGGFMMSLLGDVGETGKTR